MRAFTIILLAALSTKAQAYENVFYCIYQYDECVASDSAVSVNNGMIDELLERVGARKDNFIGFIDAEGTTLQFYVDAINDIWVEIPVPEKQGSFGKQIMEVEMNEIINNLKHPYSDYKTRLGLKFRAW